MVTVITGVGVGGGSTIGKVVLGGSIRTRGAYTQANPPGAPGYSTKIHSPPGERPLAGARCPTSSVPTRSYKAFGPERKFACGSFPAATTTIGPPAVLVTVGISTVGICAR